MNDISDKILVYVRQTLNDFLAAKHESNTIRFDLLNGNHSVICGNGLFARRKANGVVFLASAASAKA